MTIAKQYIGKIAELYNVADSALDKMYGNADQIEHAFEGYAWDDISRAISRYYDRKNDKTRPRIAQIIAILESERVEKVPIVDYGPKPQTRPTTKLNAIKSTFNNLIDAMIDCCVLPNDNGEFTGSASLLNADGTLMLNPIHCLQWEVEAIERDYPELFMAYPNLTFWEKLAIAVQNKKIKLRRRTWAAQGGAL